MEQGIDNDGFNSAKIEIVKAFSLLSYLFYMRKQLFQESLLKT